MAPEWIYLLKANVGIALFYAFYKRSNTGNIFINYNHRKLTLNCFN